MVARFLKTKVPNTYINRLVTDDTTDRATDTLAKNIAGVINGLLTERFWPDIIPSTTGTEPVSPSPDYYAYWNRMALDREFSEEIWPGNRAEFADGLYTIDAVVSAVPAAYKGILDLTMCNSLFLGEQLKRLCHCTRL
jgi:hypothetical protein